MSEVSESSVESTESDLSTQETPDQTPTEGDTRQDRKFTNDLHRFKKESRDMKAENERLKAEMDKMKQTSLVSQSRYKEAFENSQQEVEDLRSKLERNSNVYFNSLKASALRTEAMKAGIREEALTDLDLLDTSDVEVEVTNQGNTHISGQKEFVDQLKAVRPHWFKTKQTLNVNTDLPTHSDVGTTPKELKPIDILAMQKENPKKYREYMAKRFKRS